MQEGSGPGAVRDAAPLSPRPPSLAGALGRPPNGAKTRRRLRLLVKIAVARMPSASLAAAATGSELQELGGAPEDGPPLVTGLVSAGSTFTALALSADVGPAGTADTAYLRTAKATGGKTDSAGTAPAGPVDLSQSGDSGPLSLETAPVSAVELLDVEAFAQTAVVLHSGAATCLLRFASPDLGVVRVLVMQTRGGVNIRFVAEQELTRQMLDRQLDQLYAALANAGIDLGAMDVVGEADAGFPQEPSDVVGEGSPGEERCAARPRRSGSPPATSRLDVIV